MRPHPGGAAGRRWGRTTTVLHLATLLAAGGFAVVIAACAAKSEAPGPNTVNGPPPAADEILALENQMSNWRVELGLKPRPVSADNGAVAAEVCEGLTECKDPCKLSEAICQNAERICDIAKSDGGDWANNKCRDAKRSCKEAREVCTCCERRQQNGLLRQPQPCAAPPPAPVETK